MKIIQVINSLGTGGAEKLLLDTLPIYRERGIEMDILLLWDNNSIFTQQLVNLKCCKIYILNKSNRIASIYNPLHIFKISKIIKNYDLVHVHLFPAQYFVPIANKLNRTKTHLIFTEHNTNNRRLENSIYGLFDTIFYKSYATIICITREIRDILIKHTGLPSKKFELIENGVNLEKIMNAMPLVRKDLDPSLSFQDKILIQVSGFREQKDQETLIKAMALLPEFCKLILVGEGVLKKSCELLVNKLKLSSRVLFLGARMDVPKLLKASDIVVLSTKFEGLSLSSIEGLASGKPFLASNVPGLNEIVKGAGILFPLGDEEKLALEVSRLINNQELYSSVARACQNRAKEYDINTMVDKHLKIYKSFENY